VRIDRALTLTLGRQEQRRLAASGRTLNSAVGDVIRAKVSGTSTLGVRGMTSMDVSASGLPQTVQVQHTQGHV